jgi:protein TonB
MVGGRSRGRLRVWADSPGTRVAATRVGASVLLHLLVIAAVSRHWSWARRMPPAGTAHGSRVMLFYVPGRPSGAVQVGAKVMPRRLMARVVPTLTPKLVAVQYVAPEVEEAGATSAASLPSAEGVGSAALGSGTVSLVYIQAFPKQRPDISGLPVGASGDIVVGVRIGENGRVASATTKQGIGYGIDEMMLATVEQWIFHPATKDGRPVTSEQDLHFHYDLGRNPMLCGWECFTLVER